MEVFSMNNFATNTYQMKREIVKFSKKLCKNANKCESKFVTDLIYGISKSKDILLSSIAGELNDKIKKSYTIDRLSENLCRSLSETIDYRIPYELENLNSIFSFPRIK